MSSSVARRAKTAAVITCWVFVLAMTLLFLMALGFAVIDFAVS